MGHDVSGERNYRAPRTRGKVPVEVAIPEKQQSWLNKAWLRRELAGSGQLQETRLPEPRREEAMKS